MIITSEPAPFQEFVIECKSTGRFIHPYDKSPTEMYYTLKEGKEHACIFNEKMACLFLDNFSARFGGNLTKTPL